MNKLPIVFIGLMVCLLACSHKSIDSSDSDFIGNPSQPPIIKITQQAMDCEQIKWIADTAEVAAQANNVAWREVKVVFYPLHPLFQFTDNVADLKVDGMCSKRVRCGEQYYAVLARKSWEPPDYVPIHELKQLCATNPAVLAYCTPNN